MTADRPASEVLAAAAAAAGAAPSIHNTQPWGWEVHPDHLDLYAERDRQLTAGDPDGRMMIVSCGAALHHARVALAAEGWQVTVSRVPELAAAPPSGPGTPPPSGPGTRQPNDLLARITLAGRAQVSPEAMRLYQTVQLRRTDRRPVTREPVPGGVLDALTKAALAEGVHLQVLHPDQVDDLTAAVAQAASVDAADPAIQAELDRWTGGQRPEGVGIPDIVIPERPPQTDVPARVFARSGTLPIGGEHDREAAYTLLYGDTDDPGGWLRGGEALSAVWLAAVELGVGVLPISEAVEMPASRQTLRRTLSFFGWPYIAMRVGVPDPDHPGPGHTPRLPTSETVRLALPG